MKTLLRSPDGRRVSPVAAFAIAVFSAVLLGGVSVQAVSTNFLWNVASGAYTNDANWIAQTNGVLISNIAPCGNNPANRAAGGSINYVGLVTNAGTVSYGDGGGGPSTAYTWTNVLGQLQVGGTVANGSGTFNMSSGNLSVTNTGANNFVLGGGVSTTGSFNMTGGSLFAERVASSFFQDFLIVSASTDATAVATFTMSGGLARVFGGIEIGTGGNGTFNVNGGLLVDNGWFGVGRGGTGGTNSAGFFNLTSGTMYILRNTGNDGSGSDNGLYMGQGSSNAMANISGGTLYCIRFAGMGGAGSNCQQTLNMSGGTIYVGYLGSGTNGVGVESANISGGTFHTVDMLATTAANPGATNTVLADGTNWTWGAFPTVNLTNNTFTVNGSTGPGNVTFAPEATRTITLNNQWTGVGSMIINGPGSVAMGEVNGSTYTGGTTVSQGALIFNTAQPNGLISGVSLSAGTILALASAQTNPIIGVATIPSGTTLQLNNNGVFFESPASIPSGVLLAFNQSGSATVTNVFTGSGNIVMQGSGTVNLGSNLQNTGWIVQSNGAMVINGTILNASGVTNNGPIAAGPFCAQGMIAPPLTISSNSVIDLGTPIYVGTLNASNVNLNGAWNCKLNTATTVGSGVNDLLVCSNLVIGANSTLNILPQTPLSVGTYVLAEYSGTLTGTFNTVSNGTHDVLAVSYSTPNEILLTVSANNTNNLAWAAPIVTGGNINWDVNNSLNWTNTTTAALATYGQGDIVNFNLVTNGAGSVTNRVSVVGQVLPQAININGGAAYIFSGTGYFSGGTGINYNDTNTSGIFTGGNNYTGTVNINAGVLQLGSGGSSWLGTTDGPTVINGGTLDLNGQNIGGEPLMVQGAGSGMAGGNGGAINNSGGATSQSVPFNITLTGDTTLNASSNRWDIGLATLGAGGSTFTGNGHNLVKIGAQPIWMHEVGDIGVGNIDIQKGLLGFQFTIGMGIAADTVTVEPGATLGLFSLSTNSMLNKQLILNNNATLQSGGNAGASNNFIGPVTLNGTNFITTSSFPLVLTNVISGSGGFVLANGGPLYLGGVNIYTGPTVINTNSRIVLMPGGSIADSTMIELVPATNSALDAGTNTLTFASGQTVFGTGYIIATNANAGTGVTLSPGTNLTYGTLMFTNNLTLNGDTNSLKISDFNNIGVDNDLIVINNTLNLSGQSTILITPIAALSSANPYTVMVANGGINGTAGNLRVVSTSPRYTMTPSLNGSDVQVNVTGNAAPLLWKGYLTANWDLVTSNWLNMGTSAHDQFYNGDDPTFDDSSAVTGVTITNSILLPAGIFMSNVVNSYTFSGGGVINGQLNMEGNGSGTGGTLVLATSNAPAFSGIDSSAGRLVYNLQGVSNYTVLAPITDNLGSGDGQVVFGGTNTALLEGNNAHDVFGSHPAFYGSMWVTNGILQYTNVFCLGPDASVNGSPSFAPLIVTNNGTLDFNGVPAGPSLGAYIGGQKWIHISGTGYKGQGALIDSGNNQEANGAFCNLYLDGNATIGIASTRCDQHVALDAGGQQINGNGFNLTVIGAGALFFNWQNDGDTHFGNIDVATTNGGRLAFQGGPLALGIPTNYLMIEPGAEVTFFNISNNLDPVHFGVNKVLWMKGQAYLDSGGGAASESNNYIGPVFLTGTNIIGTRDDLHFWNTIMDSNGPGGFVLGNASVGASSADLWFDGTNSYSGATIISNRTLHVGANSSLGLSTYVQVNSGASLDLSAMPVVNFGTMLANQTLAGNGTVAGPTGGNFNFNAGGALAVGLPLPSGLANSNTYTLTINGSVVFNAGSTNYVVANKTNPNPGNVPADKLAGPASLTLGGTIVVTNFGTNLVAGDALPLYSATAITTNTFTVVPATPGPNLLWNINTMPVDGTLRVASSVTVNPQPTNIVFSVTNNLLTLSWPADHIGWQLQAQTNPVTVGIVTNNANWFNVSGTTTTNKVIIPINLANGCVFYRLTY